MMFASWDVISAQCIAFDMWRWGTNVRAALRTEALDAPRTAQLASRRLFSILAQRFTSTNAHIPVLSMLPGAGLDGRKQQS